MCDLQLALVVEAGGCREVEDCVDPGTGGRRCGAGDVGDLPGGIGDKFRYFRTGLAGPFTSSSPAKSRIVTDQFYIGIFTYDKVIVLEWVPILAAVCGREIESRILLVGGGSGGVKSLATGATNSS